MSVCALLAKVNNAAPCLCPSNRWCLLQSASHEEQDLSCGRDALLLSRVRPGLRDALLKMAIGPWHTKAHKLSCQQVYGARLMEGSGQSFGDNIEHLWANTRKHAHLLKRQTAAARQDHLVDLVRRELQEGLWAGQKLY